jgi:glycosyltransferase involved in cell wall biosynthesis
MRITFVKAGGFNLSGGDRVISIYAQRLLQRGHQVLVVCTPIPSLTLRNQFNSVIRGKGWLKAQPATRSHFSDTAVPLRLLEHYRPIVEADVPDADVVISTWWETAEWVNRLSRNKGAKVCFLQHYEAFDYTPKDRVDQTWRMPFHKITISTWLKDLARERFSDDTASLVPNSVDGDQFHAPPRPRNAVVTVGMLYHSAPWKGVSVSLKALEVARQYFPNLRLITFGNYPPAADLPLPAWADPLIITPAQDRLCKLYEQCDVWLCGSTSEGFGLTALEAMACRVPVVSTRVGGPVDLIRDGENGYLVSIGDSNALADRVIRVLSLESAAWQRMSDNAYATAMRYTWDDATDLFESALGIAIDRDARGELRASETLNRQLPRANTMRQQVRNIA